MRRRLLAEPAGAVLQRTPINLAVYVFYTFIVGLSSFFPIAARTEHFVLLCGAYALVGLVPLGFILFWVRSRLIHRILGHPVFWLGCLAFLAWYGESHFLKLVLPHPNDLTAAPALMLPAQNLFHGKNPYAVQLAGHAPVSPGPGWILLLSPITLARGAGLLTFLGTLLVSLLLAARARVSAGLFLLLTLLQPDLLWTSIWGTDLFLIPLAFAALCLLSNRYAGKPTAMFIIGCVAGVFAQSRLPMAALVFILAVGLWRKNPHAARRFILAAILVCAGLYLWFYVWTIRDHLYFQPLHLLHRERRSGLWASIVGPAGGLLVLLWVVFRMTGQVRDWLLAAAILVAILFAPTGLGELVTRWGNVANWEGANYISFGLSLFVCYLALGTSRHAGLPGSGTPQKLKSTVPV